jgi:hypothetical protein
MSDISENLVGVDELLQTLGDACVRSASRIEAISDSARVGSVRYTVPEFRVKVKLSFTKTGGNVTGILFWKKSEGFSSESLSEIEMNIVAVPRTGNG